MPINTDLLIAAPMLQDYLVDKDTGGPLSNGIVTMYKDNQRDRKSTRLNSSHIQKSRMPSSA